VARIDEPEGDEIIELLRGNTLIGTRSILWENGNAFSAMFKRELLSLEEAKRALEIFNKIPLRYIEPDLINAKSIVQKNKMYAYDAYFPDCALRQKAPSRTLDSNLNAVAKNLNISTFGV
jgi:predicted nucleic acid-binding protein